MSRTPAKPVQMACLTIGYERILLPAKSAIAIAEAMQHAVPVDVDFEGNSMVYLVKQEPLRVDFSLLRSSRIRMPHSDPTPTPMPQRRLSR